MAVATRPLAPSRGNFITRNHFWFRRLHSLSGVLPIGGFLLFHFWENSKVFSGAAAYNEMATAVREIQFILLLEIFAVALPILYHALYGMYIAYYARSNSTQYTYARNWMFTLQRLSGLWALAFLVYHYATLRLGIFLVDHADYSTMAILLRDPLAFAFYTVSIIAIAFHFANGLWSFMVTWGITVSKRSQQISAFAMTGVGLLVAVWGVAIALRFLLAGLGIMA